jgi:hypothetical protein
LRQGVISFHVVASQLQTVLLTLQSSILNYSTALAMTILCAGQQREAESGFLKLRSLSA